MARRGTKPARDTAKVLRGTFRKSRSHPTIVAAIDGDPIKPTWLKGAASRIWDDKVADYRQRKLSVRGCEGPLAVYCALEAALVASWRRGIKPMAADLAQYRIYANEFYDTPASHQGPAVKRGDNPFARNGCWPARSSSSEGGAK